MLPSNQPRPFTPEHSDPDAEADKLVNSLRGPVVPMNTDARELANYKGFVDELEYIVTGGNRIDLLSFNSIKAKHNLGESDG